VLASWRSGRLPASHGLARGTWERWSPSCTEPAPFGRPVVRTARRERPSRAHYRCGSSSRSFFHHLGENGVVSWEG
jgi:hypothetical protein